jgi:hypothetical protein
MDATMAQPDLEKGMGSPTPEPTSALQSQFPSTPTTVKGNVRGKKRSLRHMKRTHISTTQFQINQSLQSQINQLNRRLDKVDRNFLLEKVAVISMVLIGELLVLWIIYSGKDFELDQTIKAMIYVIVSGLILLQLVEGNPISWK